QDLSVTMGMRFDFGGDARLLPGKSLELPEVAFTASSGDLDDVANQFHRYQRRYVFAHTPTNSPPLVTMNVWQVTRRNPKAADIKHFADLIAPLGMEALIIDSGWFQHEHHPNADSPTDPTLPPIWGNWEPDSEYFPKGLSDVADYTHAKGMKFGVWIEIESVSTKSRVAHEHPDWIMKYNGKPLAGSLNRVYLDFANPDARAWAQAVLERLITKEKVDWFKFDYNVDLGDAFDPSAIDARSGTVLRDHLKGFFEMLDAVRAKHPNVVFENCASGGMRTDLAIMRHMHTSWTSDTTETKRNAQMDYGCTLEFAPEICDHWVVGDSLGSAAGDGMDGRVFATDTDGWLETMVRMPMAGQMGFSSRVAEWPPAMTRIAKQGIADYKRIRPIIATSDVYHLTPPMAAGTAPKGWMALEFIEPTATRAVVLTFRLAESRGTETLHLRGLDPTATYNVTGQGLKEGHYPGAELMQSGLPVTRTTEWDSSIVELTRVAQ
ncbi:MAG: alpha-galactosidase, partial [Bryocella sp.]